MDGVKIISLFSLYSGHFTSQLHHSVENPNVCIYLLEVCSSYAREIAYIAFIILATRKADYHQC